MNVIRFSEAENYEPEKDWKRVSLCNQEDISVEHFIKPLKHAQLSIARSPQCAGPYCSERETVSYYRQRWRTRAL